ncbi:MAG: hypothetical protein JWQ98_1617 [Chlorobi bacterium]|nr:hypothetical protein [Chlorobiota bacterium]
MNGLLIETDLLIDFLLTPHDEASLFRRLLELTPCYSTFLNAAELYGAARSDEERRMVDRPLFGLKILGASSRYAKTIGSVLSSEGIGGDHRIAIIAGMAIESSLPVITERHFEIYAGIPGLDVIRASVLRQSADREALKSLLAPHL